MVKEYKVQAVEELRDKLTRSTIAVGARFQGLTAQQTSDLRRRLQAQGIEFKVVRNTLASIAAAEAGKTSVEVVLQGPTGIAFGYGDPVEPAKILAEFARATRLPLEINGAFMDGKTLTAEEVRTLAALPPREQLLSSLLGQMQAPIAQLLYVLSAPIQALATVLHRAAESGAEAEAPAAEGPAAEPSEEPAVEAKAETETLEVTEEEAPGAAEEEAKPE